VWVNSILVVIGVAKCPGFRVENGRYVSMSASKSMSPSSTHCITAVAVKVLETEASRYGVCGVAKTFPATSAYPYDFIQTISPSFTITADTEGNFSVFISALMVISNAD